MSHPREEARDPVLESLLATQDLVARLHFERMAACAEREEAVARASLLQRSVAFRLGRILTAACKSPRGFLRMPGALWRLIRDRARRGGCHAAASVVAEVSIKSMPNMDASATSAYFQRRVRPVDRLSELRVAAVLDEFSRAGLAPECTILDLPPKQFEASLDAFRPHMLLVESAWRGKGGMWMHKVCPLSVDLQYVVDCCRRRGIPTVFWNKEDPSHFDNFIGAAKLFDHVFTSDSDCISRYRVALGHGRVYPMMFGCQPRMHHPVEHFERRNAFCFAGSWYQRYPERGEAFDSVMRVVDGLLPVDIYDRNVGRNDPNFEFPGRYRPLIRGSLPYTQIDRAYKGYRFAININTITRSPTMLARRVFELMASNTIVVSNPSLAMDAVFGELVVHAPEPSGSRGRLRMLVDDPVAQRKMRLRALRCVLSEHTYAVRLRDMASAVLRRHVELSRPAVMMVTRISDLSDWSWAIDTFMRQSWSERHMVVFVPEAIKAQLPAVPEGVHVYGADEHEVHGVYDRGDFWVAPLHRDDHYGTTYVEDLALATLFVSGTVIGKGAFYVWGRSGVLRPPQAPSYVEDQPLWLRASLMRCTSPLSGERLRAWLRSMEDEEQPSLRGLAVDEFSYCRNGRACLDVSAVEVPTARSSGT